MAVVRLSLGQLAGALRENAARVDMAVRRSAAATAVDTAHMMAANAPIAFGDLRSSIHAEVTEKGGRAVADAPHAAAVEVGSRPHWVPLDALVRWVKLRGAQGLDKGGNVKASSRKAWGSTTAEHSSRVASQIKSLERNGTNSVDDAVTVAKAIQRAIAKRGTKPHWFARKSLPPGLKALDRYIGEALKRA